MTYRGEKNKCKIEISACGVDEQEALSELSTLLNSSL